MSAAPAVCGRTQDKLDDLRARIKKGELDEKDYFFTNNEYKGQESAVPPKWLPRVDLGPTEVRCLQCGKTIDEHAPIDVTTSSLQTAPAKRDRCDGFFRLTVKVIRGATYQNLRKHAFALAEDCHALKSGDGYCIQYGLPVTYDSDLDAILYFRTIETAENMESAVNRAVREYLALRRCSHCEN